MAYDFDSLIKRYNCGSEKWDILRRDYGVDPNSDYVPMGNAEMEFPNAPEITEGLREFLKNAIMAYYDFEFDPGYFEAVVGWMEHRHNWKIDADSIVPTPGLHCGTPVAVEAFSKPGDGVIDMEPTWPGFFGAIRRAGRYRLNSPLYEENGRYYIDFDHFEKLASDPKNTLLMFCSPQNPVSRVWTKGEIERVADICLRNDVTIVSDELHADLVMPGYKHTSFASIDSEVAAHTVVCTAPSKSFNLAGLSTSNVIIANKELRDRYRAALRGHYVQAPNMLGAKACEIAYTKAEPWLDACIKKIESNAQLVNDYLKANLPMIKATKFEATYLMWLDMRALNVPYKQLENDLMDKAHVYIDDGYYFGSGCEGFERVNIACPTHVLGEALERIRNYVNSL